MACERSPFLGRTINREVSNEDGSLPSESNVLQHCRREPLISGSFRISFGMPSIPGDFPLAREDIALAYSLIENALVRKLSPCGNFTFGRGGGGGGGAKSLVKWL